MKKRLIDFIKRYKLFLLLLVTNLLLLAIMPSVGIKSFTITKDNLLEMISVIPPVFILLGLLDVWVKKDTMMKYMGDKSGMIGIVVAFFLGSVAAGPLYAAFPIAGVLLKKGSNITNVLIFIGAWSTMKIPLLMFEISSLGMNFAILRLCINVVGILLIAFTIDSLLNKKDRSTLYRLAEFEN